MKQLRKASGIIFLLILLSSAIPTQASEKFFRTLDSYIERARQDWEVPGLAVGIIKDVNVVFAKGYGVRKLGEPTPVDSATLFGIASNTKAFTAAALAILADEGKITWDDPVIKHMPDFQMYDPYVTREMTIRDLLTHRSGLGLGAGDLLIWPHSTYSRKEIISRLRFIRPASSFRSRYAYDNILYIVAGEIIPAVTGKSWSNFIKERIFIPLGMTSSNTSVKDFRPEDNRAIPHARFEGRVQPITYQNLDNAQAAGAINSNVSDMAKWIITQLDTGLIQKKQGSDARLFSVRMSKEMWAAQTVIPIGEYPSVLSAIRPNFSAYGLGWRLADYRGHKIVSHSGTLAGMVSRVTLVPDLKLGIVILTNQESHGACQAINYHVLDNYLGAPPTDWIGAFRRADQEAEEKAAEVEKNQQNTRVLSSKPSLEIAKYGGRYIDQWYGEMTIKLENGNLVMSFSHSPDLVGDLEHWHYDTFVVRWKDRSLKADAFVTFALKHDGTIDQIKMIPVSPLTDFSYDFQDLLFKPAAAKAKEQ